ncbi:MAG: Unknown protein [uncultured Sulfurovum sp.]|uniref:Periplasmic protein n=1 Tax=uncultured Sulfurovum sp. TaxID=269237 RepID=A0A6S6TKF9_9BACT|nr:MAG: Unknown protein [uncultured Sulfurovum sp.]
MKKIITLSLVLGLTSLLLAEGNVSVEKKEITTPMTKEMGHKAKENKPQHKVAELVPLPHLKRLLAANKETLKLSKEQNEKIKAEIFENFRAKIHKEIKVAEQLESKIMDAVLKEQKTKEDLKADIEKLIEIKREITNGHIDALNTLAKILTKEQYSTILNLLAQKKSRPKH